MWSWCLPLSEGRGKDHAAARMWRVPGLCCGFVLLASLLCCEAALKERESSCSSRREGGKHGKRLATIGALLLLSMMLCGAARADEPVYDIDIPSMNAAEALNRFAEQTGAVMLFSYDLARARRANTVRGRYTMLQGLDLLLRGTGLSGGLSDKRVVSISQSGNNQRLGEAVAVQKEKASWMNRFVAYVGAIFAVTPGARAADEAPATQTVEEVTVTGSRIARRDLTSSTPIVTTTANELSESGRVNLESTLQQLPQFSPSRDEADNAGAFGGGGRATVNLRGLGENRTLVLLDGRRAPPSNGSMVVDLNAIPLGVIESVEIITGGASAAYGSDAVAGVVNIRTRDVKGLEIQAAYGESFEGDGARKDISIAYGNEFAEGRGSAVLAFGYTDRDMVPNSSRAFFRDSGPSGTTFFGAAGVSAANLPSQAGVDAIFGQYGAAAGSVSRGQAFGFNADGSLFSRNAPLVNYQGPGPEEGYVTSSGALIYNTNRDAWLVVPQERYSFFARADYEIAPSVEAFGQFLFSNSNVTTNIGFTPVFPAGVLTIPVTNPFIAPGSDLADLLASRPNPTAPFVYDKRFNEAGSRIFEEDFDTFNGTLGLRGDLSSIDGRWEIYASHSEMHQDSTRHNAIFIQPLQALLSAPDGGASLCDGGFNPFLGLNGSLSQDCLNLIGGDVRDVTTVEQEIVEASVQGRLFTLPAGEVRFALVAGYRDDSFAFAPDHANVTASHLAIVPTVSSSGTVSVKELAGELLIPILRDSRLADELNLGLGYRYSDYDVSGGVSTYRASLDWRVTEAFMLRGGYSRAVRAANPLELYSSPTAGLVQLGTAPAAGDPCDINSAARAGANAANVRALCLATGVSASLIDIYQFTTGATDTINSGNTGLSPETADSYTAGFVFAPRFDSALLNDLTLTVDYYDISLSDAIAVVDGITSINKCYNLDGSNPTYSAANPFCSNVVRPGGDGRPTMLQRYFNLGGYETSGVDVAVTTNMDIGPGTLQLSSAWSYLLDFEVQTLPGTPWRDFAGTVNLPTASVPAMPEWRGISSASYQIDDFDVGLRWRYVDAMADSTSVTRPASPALGVPSRSYFDLTAGWRISERASIDLTVANLTEEDPPIVGAVPGQTNRGLYEVLGRTYTVRLKANF